MTESTAGEVINRGDRVVVNEGRGQHPSRPIRPVVVTVSGLTVFLERRGESVTFELRTPKGEVVLRQVVLLHDGDDATIPTQFSIPLPTHG